MTSRSPSWRLAAPFALCSLLAVGPGCATRTPTPAAGPPAVETSGPVVVAEPRPSPAPAPAPAAEPVLEPVLAPEVTRAATTSGAIVPLEVNLRRFSPEESLTPVDATNVDLRTMWADLGSDATEWYHHVWTLSNPFFEGRSAGLRGFELAEEYVAFWCRRLGLEPAFPEAGDDGGPWTTYVQPFTYAGGRRPAVVGEPVLELGSTAFEHGTDYQVLAQSGGEPVTAPITFVGYGIEEGQDGYTSFDDETDLTGRIALVLRYEPLDESGRSRWSERRFSQFAGLSAKFRSLARRGAAGIMLVTPPAATDAVPGLVDLAGSAGFGRAMELPVVQITPAVAEAVLAVVDPEGGSLAAWRGRADAGAVRTVDFDAAATVTLAATVDTAQALIDSSNVGGVLPGAGRFADEWIVVGGHYDHIGYGGRGSLSGDTNRIHPGADDNASGTAAMLVLARRMAAWYAGPDAPADRRSVLFLAFGAEEVGLRGSAHFTRNAPMPAESISLMINLDMIGRVRSDSIMLAGTGTAEEFDEMLPRLVDGSGLRVHADPAGRGPSDHANFYSASIPVLFFFSGITREYHRPSDTADTVNPIGAVRIVDLVERIVREVAVRAEALTFKGTGNAGRGEGGGGGGPRVRLGFTPAREAAERGIAIGSIAPDSTAEAAGMQAGDVLLAWDGDALNDMAGLFAKLQAARPGQEVTFRVLRDGQEIDLTGTLRGR